jgi:hypothetical protein
MGFGSVRALATNTLAIPIAFSRITQSSSPPFFRGLPRLKPSSTHLRDGISSSNPTRCVGARRRCAANRGSRHCSTTRRTTRRCFEPRWRVSLFGPYLVSDRVQRFARESRSPKSLIPVSHGPGVSLTFVSGTREITREGTGFSGGSDPGGVFRAQRVAPFPR